MLFLVECQEKIPRKYRKNPRGKIQEEMTTKVIQKSSIFPSIDKANKFIEIWSHSYNTLGGRNVEFKIFNNRVNPQKFK